jgi:4-hydroxy-tetrahydrodipicolinate synthase
MFHGVFTPMVTAFDEQGRLDPGGNRRMIRHLLDGGVHGVLILGSIGEFFALAPGEKRALIDLAVESVGGRIPVLVGTGGTEVGEVIELTRYAARSGAQAGVAISPYYFTLDPKSLYRYYAAIARAVEWPLLLYNFPDRTGVELSPELILKLAREFPHVVGVKDTVDSISHTRAVIELVKPVRPNFAVLSGFDEYLVPNLLAGGDGLIGGLSNVAPRLLLELYQACRLGQVAKLKARQRRVNKLMALYAVSQPFVGAIKAAVSLVVPGVRPACRPPAGKLDARQMATIRNTLKAADVPLP